MVATLAWIERSSPAAPDPGQHAVRFEAELLDSTRYDLELSIDLTEPVLALPRGDGSGFDIEHPPEPTLPPMFAQGTATFLQGFGNADKLVQSSTLGAPEA
jgi:hypothetical protein